MSIRSKKKLSSENFSGEQAKEYTTLIKNYKNAQKTRNVSAAVSNLSKLKNLDYLSKREKNKFSKMLDQIL